MTAFNSQCAGRISWCDIFTESSVITFAVAEYSDSDLYFLCHLISHRTMLHIMNDFNFCVNTAVEMSGHFIKLLQINFIV